MSTAIVNLLSRKFLVAIGSIAALVANKQYEAAVALAIAYLGVQTGIDVKKASASVVAEVTKVDDAVQTAQLP